MMKKWRQYKQEQNQNITWKGVQSALMSFKLNDWIIGSMNKNLEWMFV